MAVIKGTVTPEASIGGTVNVQKTVIAESNAEMIDARSGHDGSLFKSVGEAIRTQVTNLWNAVNGKQPAGNYLTEESDPTVPEWAKAEVKPSYTADEVGATPVDHLEDMENPHSVNFLQVGSVKIQKVWENASPTSDFKAQTIALDLSDAEMVMIKFKAQASSTSTTRNFAFGYVGEQAPLVGFLNLGAGSNSMEFSYRLATVSSTGIEFGSGYKKSTGSSSTGEAKAERSTPVEIYTLKGVLL